MTTVAWDGKTLSADTLSVNQNLKRKVQKLFRLKDGRLYAGCGEYDDVLAAKDWMENGGNKPSLKDFAALLVTPEGAFRLEGHLIPHKIHEPFFAIGSGRDFAIMAMHLGKSSAESVELATLFDAWTATPVETMSLSEPLLRAVG